MTDKPTETTTEEIWDYAHQLENIIDALCDDREIPHQHLYRGKKAQQYRLSIISMLLSETDKHLDKMEWKQ